MKNNLVYIQQKNVPKKHLIYLFSQPLSLVRCGERERVRSLTSKYGPAKWKMDSAKSHIT